MLGKYKKIWLLLSIFIVMVITLIPITSPVILARPISEPLTIPGFPMQVVGPTITTGNATSLAISRTGLTAGYFVVNVTDLGSGDTSGRCCWFEYGTTGGYGSSTAKSTFSTLGNKTKAIPTNLLINTTYHFRAAASFKSNAGTTYGADNTFIINPPSATTAASSGIAKSTSGWLSGTLNGSVSSLGNASSVYGYFEYGPTTSYGLTTSLSSKTKTGAFTASIPSGIMTNASYHYRTVLKMGTQYIYGSDQPFGFPVASGEIRSTAGSLTSGNTNAIAFSWHNPETADIYITKVVIDVTTQGGTGGSTLQVGIADNAGGTNLGSELFSGLDLNIASLNDSWSSSDTGAMTHFVLCQDSASATDGWIVGKILTQNAASLVGKYYIFYCGK
jgi:hypothetical protein